jgi:hypothetical protein
MYETVRQYDTALSFYISKADVDTLSQVKTRVNRPQTLIMEQIRFKNHKISCIHQGYRTFIIDAYKRRPQVASTCFPSILYTTLLLNPQYQHILAHIPEYATIASGF